jgi:hypothetical protein
MKLEIEVSEAELKDALARHVRTAVADRVNSWGQQAKLKEIVAAKYDELVREIVVEELKKSDAIRKQVQEAMVSKIRGQLTAAMKVPK